MCVYIRIPTYIRKNIRLRKNLLLNVALKGLLQAFINLFEG